MYRKCTDNVHKMYIKCTENVHKMYRKCTENGAQRVISAAIKCANVLQVQIWFCGVKRIWNVECHSDYEDLAKPIIVPEKKFKTNFSVHYMILSINPLTSRLMWIIFKD